MGEFPIVRPDQVGFVPWMKLRLQTAAAPARSAMVIWGSATCRCVLQDKGSANSFVRLRVVLGQVERSDAFDTNRCAAPGR
jgi:hypothetical protein